MRIRFSFAGLIIFVLCGATSPAQEIQPSSDPREVSVLIMKNGDWKWVKGLERNGPTFEFYEETGRNVKRERFVSMPEYLVDVEAVVAVNASLIELRSACGRGEAANFETDLEGRARRIFIELAISGAAGDGTGSQDDGSCFFSTPMGVEIKGQPAAAAGPILSSTPTSALTSTPTPRPTRTPTPLPVGIVCNVFEGHVTVSGGKFQISLDTDLPDDTDLMVGVARTYRAEGDEGVASFLAHSLSEKSTVGEWKNVRFVDVSSESLHHALDQEVKRIQSTGIQHDVVDGSMSQDIEVSFVVPVNQANPAFGKSNEYLSGPMVRQDGTMRLIRWERLYPIPSATGRSDTASLVYKIVKTESSIGIVDGRFEDGTKIHVVTTQWGLVEHIATEIAATQSTRSVGVFFWNNANEVGTQSATVGVELIDGEIIDVFLDQR